MGVGKGECYFFVRYYKIRYLLLKQCVVICFNKIRKGYYLIIREEIFGFIMQYFNKGCIVFEREIENNSLYWVMFEKEDGLMGNINVVIFIMKQIGKCIEGVKKNYFYID